MLIDCHQPFDVVVVDVVERIDRIECKAPPFRSEQETSTIDAQIGG